MKDNFFGFFFILLGVAFILFFLKTKFKTDTGLAYKIKGVTAGIVSIILGIAFLLGKFK